MATALRTLMLALAATNDPHDVQFYGLDLGGGALLVVRSRRGGLLGGVYRAYQQFAGQRAFEFSALLAFAIPGTVLGVSYILAFNVPPFELTGTGLIIVLCFVFRNLPVGVRAGTASFKQLDKSLDEASTMLRAGTAGPFAAFRRRNWIIVAAAGPNFWKPRCSSTS